MRHGAFQHQDQRDERLPNPVAMKLKGDLQVTETQHQTVLSFLRNSRTEDHAVAQQSLEAAVADELEAEAAQVALREIGPDAIRRALDDAQHGTGVPDQLVLAVGLRLPAQRLLQVVVEVLARVVVGRVSPSLGGYARPLTCVT